MSKIARSVRNCLANGSATRLHRRGIATAIRQAFIVVGFAALLGGCGWVEDSLMAFFKLAPEHIIVENRADTAYEGLSPITSNSALQANSVPS